MATPLKIEMRPANELCGKNPFFYLLNRHSSNVGSALKIRQGTRACRCKFSFPARHISAPARFLQPQFRIPQFQVFINFVQKREQGFAWHILIERFK